MTSLASLTRPITLVATTAALCAGVGVATGAIPSGEGQIHGCFQKTDGALRVIDAEEPRAGCKRSEAPIAWSQQGPEGQPGPQGPPGLATTLWAVVRGSDGSLLRGSRVVETSRDNPGAYGIVFDAPIVGERGDRPLCAINVTPTHLDDDIHTSVSPMTYTASPTTIGVEMWRDGIAGEDPRIRVDQSFALAVIC